MSEQMNFPATFKEFAETYKIVDSEQVYTNSAELIPIFRVEQWLEHISQKIEHLNKSRDKWKRLALDFDKASRATEKEIEMLYEMVGVQNERKSY